MHSDPKPCINIIQKPVNITEKKRFLLKFSYCFTAAAIPDLPSTVLFLSVSAIDLSSSRDRNRANKDNP